MAGKIITFGLQKGGVAKTTSTLNTSAILAKMGYKVLMVDNDPQASLTVISGYEDVLNLEHTVVDVYDPEEKIDIHDCILPVACCNNLYILPSHIKLANMEMKLIVQYNRETILSKALSALRNEFDFICIDSPPSLGILNINGIMASDAIICCCEPAVMAVEGLKLYNHTIAEIKYQMEKEIDFLGVIITKIKMGNDSKDLVEVLEDNYTILAKTKDRVQTSKGEIDGIPLVISSPSHINSLAYKKVADRIVEWSKEV